MHSLADNHGNALFISFYPFYSILDMRYVYFSICLQDLVQTFLLPNLKVLTPSMKATNNIIQRSS